MILIDSDLWIDFFAGADPGAAAVVRLLGERRAAISVISVFELACGAQRQKQVEEIKTLVSTIEPILLTRSAAQKAGEYYLQLRSRGRLIDNEDLMVAATAIELDIAVLTRNRDHFSRIAGLEVLSPQTVLAE